MNKKANEAIIAVLVVIIVIIIIAWLVNLGSKECRSDKHCEEDSYCGSDFTCHKIPVIEKTVVNQEYDFTSAALILGIAIIIAAVILKWKRKDKDKGGKKESNEFYEGFKPYTPQEPPHSRILK